MGYAGCSVKSANEPNFSVIHSFLVTSGRILQALTCNGDNPLHVNGGRILPEFGRKMMNYGKTWMLCKIGILQTICHFILKLLFAAWEHFTEKLQMTMVGFDLKIRSRFHLQNLSNLPNYTNNFLPKKPQKFLQSISSIDRKLTSQIIHTDNFRKI